MKRTIVRACVALSALIVAALPATAAVADPAEAPTGVTLAWDGNRVQVTWQESGDLADEVTVEFTQSPGGPYTTPIAGQTIAAGAPNRIDLSPAAWFGSHAIGRIEVVADPAGAPSMPGYSPEFGIPVPPSPTAGWVVEHADGTVTMHWTPGTAAPDTTPNDPLDAGNNAVTGVAVLYQTTGFNAPVSPVSQATSVTVAARSGTFYVFAVASNRWGGTIAPEDAFGALLVGELGDRTLTLNVATSSEHTTFSGNVTNREYECHDNGLACDIDTAPGSGTQLHLQTRVNSHAAWTDLGTTTTSSTGSYRITATMVKDHQYRVFAPLTIGGLFFPSYAQPDASKTITATKTDGSSQTVAAGPGSVQSTAPVATPTPTPDATATESAAPSYPAVTAGPSVTTTTAASSKSTSGLPKALLIGLVLLIVVGGAALLWRRRSSTGRHA